MIITIYRLSVALVAAMLLASPAAAESPTIKAMQEYMEFAPYEAGIIVPQQLTKDIFDKVVFIDTRDAGQFAKGTILGSPQHRVARSADPHRRDSENKKLFCSAIPAACRRRQRSHYQSQDAITSSSSKPGWKVGKRMLPTNHEKALNASSPLRRGRQAARPSSASSSPL